MAKGPVGIRRPFVKEDGQNILLEYEPSEFSDIRESVLENKGRVESRISFLIEDGISGEFRDFPVEDVIILFGGSSIMFRIETGSESVGQYEFDIVNEKIAEAVGEESERVAWEMGRWRIGTGEMGLIDGQ